MNTARAALKSAKSAGKSFVKPKYADGGLLGANLEELIRQATAKELPGPDHQINRQVRVTLVAPSKGSGVHRAWRVLCRGGFHVC